MSLKTPTKVWSSQSLENTIFLTDVPVLGNPFVGGLVRSDSPEGLAAPVSRRAGKLMFLPGSCYLDVLVPWWYHVGPSYLDVPVH